MVAPGVVAEARARTGFTLVEVVVAIVILAFGILGMAGTTAYIVRQTSLAEVTSERAAALQSVVERIRALPFDSVDAGSTTVGQFQADWTIPSTTSDDKTVEVVTTGPGLVSGAGLPMLGQNVADTFTFQVLAR